MKTLFRDPLPTFPLWLSGAQPPVPPSTYLQTPEEPSILDRERRVVHACTQATLVPGIKHQGLSFTRQAFPLVSYIHLQSKSNHFICVCTFVLVGVCRDQTGTKRGVL